MYYHSSEPECTYITNTSTVSTINSGHKIHYNIILSDKSYKVGLK